MATMINCAIDWTFDLFIEDVALYKATPIKGVHCRKNASDREEFMVWLKNTVRDFRIEFEKEYGNPTINRNGFYSNHSIYIGDFFERELHGYYFSDFYKDTYGQRPHLPMWFYIHALGLSMQEDVPRLFCANPIEDAIENAKTCREALEEEARKMGF